MSTNLSTATETRTRGFHDFKYYVELTNNDLFVIIRYLLFKVSGIPIGNKLIKTI